MDELNPIVNLPEKKANTWLIIAIISIVLLIGCGAYLAINIINGRQISDTLKQLKAQYTQMQEQNSQLQSQLTLLANEKTKVEEALKKINESNNTSNWNIYTNELNKFSFKFPKDWMVITDNIPTKSTWPAVQESGPNQYLQVGVNNGSSTLPSLIIWVNPAGFGPFFTNKRYDIRMDARYPEKGYIIDSQKTLTDNTDPSEYSIFISEMENSGNTRLVMLAKQSIADQFAFDDLVKTILGTFQFNK